MKRNEIKNKLINLISENGGIPKYEISEKDNFANDLCFDSMDTIELIMDVEAKFNIQISDELADGVMIVKDAIDLIHKTINI